MCPNNSGSREIWTPPNRASEIEEEEGDDANVKAKVKVIAKQSESKSEVKVREQKDHRPYYHTQT